MNLELRVKKLERRCNALIVVLVCLLGMGAYRGIDGKFHTLQADIIATKAIQLEDEQGLLIGQWSKSPDGSCQFVMSDLDIAGGKPSRSMRVIVEQGLSQVILEQGGKESLGALSINKGKAGCYVKDKDGILKDLAH